MSCEYSTLKVRPINYIMLTTIISVYELNFFALSRNVKESENPVLWPWLLTYDLEILWDSSGCQGTCSCKISSSSVQRFMSYRANREKKLWRKQYSPSLPRRQQLPDVVASALAKCCPRGYTTERLRYTVSTWSVKLWYDSDAAHSSLFNNLGDGFVSVHVGNGVVSTLINKYIHMLHLNNTLLKMLQRGRVAKTFF